MKLLSFLGVFVLGFNAFAQDKGVDLNVSVDKGGQWYTQPWIWIVAGLVFILLLAAILRGGKKA